LSQRLDEWDAMKANQFNVHFELQLCVDYTSSYAQALSRLASGSGPGQASMNPYASFLEKRQLMLQS
jgi:hypothetical protein